MWYSCGCVNKVWGCVGPHVVLFHYTLSATHGLSLHNTVSVEDHAHIEAVGWSNGKKKHHCRTKLYPVKLYRAGTLAFIRRDMYFLHHVPNGRYYKHNVTGVKQLLGKAQAS